MEEWGGFTDDDLRRLKRQSTGSAGPPSRQMGGTPGRGRQTARGRGQVRPATQRQASGSTAMGNQLPPEMKLSQPKKEKHDVSPVANTAEAGVETKVESEEKKVEQVEEAPPKEVKEIDETEFTKKQLSTVEHFQMQQKLMEEQNKQKKKLLTSALMERQLKAKTDFVRLATIQRELSQLDQLLQVDVSLIRNRIEDASRDFLEAQRRYERAEKEFIESKMELHRKSELKESLTEHLYTIIHQNEMRKAKKLTELMEKLDMEGQVVSGDDIRVELTCLPEMVPQMSTLGDTIHVPRSPAIITSTTSPQLLSEPTANSDSTTAATDTSTAAPPDSSSTTPAPASLVTPSTPDSDEKIEQKKTNNLHNKLSEETDCGASPQEVSESGKNRNGLTTDQNDNIPRNEQVTCESPESLSPAVS